MTIEGDSGDQESRYSEYNSIPDFRAPHDMHNDHADGERESHRQDHVDVDEGDLVDAIRVEPCQRKGHCDGDVGS